MYNKRNGIRKKYTKQLENLEEKNTSKNEEVTIPIIIKFDDETGGIIDDRE